MQFKERIREKKREELGNSAKTKIPLKSNKTILGGVHSILNRIPMHYPIESTTYTSENSFTKPLDRLTRTWRDIKVRVFILVISSDHWLRGWIVRHPCISVSLPLIFILICCILLFLRFDSVNTGEMEQKYGILQIGDHAWMSFSFLLALLFSSAPAKERKPENDDLPSSWLTQKRRQGRAERSNFDRHNKIGTMLFYFIEIVHVEAFDMDFNDGVQ